MLLNNFFHVQGLAFSGITMIFLVLLVSCGGSNIAEDSEDFKKLQDLVSEGRFEIENQWASPNNGGNINLIGNPNSIEFNKDSVDVFLPYFGVRQSGGGYGSDQGGIKYEGIAKNLETSENLRKGSIEITFEAIENGESLNFRVTLYPNNSARTYVISNQRTTIFYEGKWRKLEEYDN